MPIARHSVALLLAASSAAALTGCSLKMKDTSPAGYVQTNLVANWSAYHPQIVEPGLKNAWGISLRPAGAGGHFWITANGNGTSYEYTGDVRGTSLRQDDLKAVTIPSVDDQPGTPTGTVFNDHGNGFAVTQTIQGEQLTQPAKFLFATDSGLVAGWTEKDLGGGKKAFPTDSVTLWDHSKDGASYLGMAISPRNDRLYLANFGENPGIVVLDNQFKQVESPGFANPFGTTYQPFNVQTIGDSVFVTYAEWEKPGEEEHGPGEGFIAEFSPDGQLIAKWDGGRYLNAPWGVAKAPASAFGVASGDLLVGNFGDGTIAVLDPITRKAKDFLRRPDRNRVEIAGLWALTFGNGASLGGTNALYFAAGPGPEADGIFGRLTWQE